MKRKVITKKSAPGDLTADMLCYLLHGIVMGAGDPPEAEARAAWTKNREKILAMRAAEMTAENYVHGTRPFAWWQYEDREPRRQIAGPTVEQIGSDYYQGIPRLMKEWPVGTEFESQFSYLKRHGLLFAGEADAVFSMRNGKIVTALEG